MRTEISASGSTPNALFSPTKKKKGGRWCETCERKYTERASNITIMDDKDKNISVIK